MPQVSTRVRSMLKKTKPRQLPLIGWAGLPVSIIENGKIIVEAEKAVFYGNKLLKVADRKKIYCCAGYEDGTSRRPLSE
jgi:hypothetical protein